MGRIHDKLAWAANGVAHSLEASRAASALRRPIDPSLVFVDSRAGLDFAGNMLRIVLEVRRRYGSRYRIVVGAEPGRREYIRGMLDAYGLGDVATRAYNGRAYFRDLETARFVLTDSTLPPAYVKREGQVVLNTWHGTPLKRMGFDSPQDRTSCDNVQRNLLFADYLLFPSRYCLEKMAGAFSLDGLYAGTVLMEGYPRNAVFFDAEARERTRRELELGNRRVYAMLPTWRQGTRTAAETTASLIDTLRGLDDLLDDGEVLFLKLHNLAREQMSRQGPAFRHIRLFPQTIETYELLNAADCLVTDYSSVFYDYASSPGKIVLFKQDEQGYLEERGVYAQPVELPFPTARTVDELVCELRLPKQYDDGPFRSAFCPHDGPDAASRVVRTVFEGEEACERLSIHDPSRRRTLFYAGGLGKNGITSSLRSLVALMPPDEQPFVAYSGHLMKGRQHDLANLPEGIPTVCISGSFRCATPVELAAVVAYYVLGLDVEPARALVDRFFEREARRCFAGMDFDAFIEFCGYERFSMGLFQRGPAHTAVWVHSDMLGEMAVKTSQRRRCLGNAYRAYERVACVSQDVVGPTSAISGRSDNIRVVENCIDVDAVRTRASAPVDSATANEIRGATSDIASFIGAHRPTFVTIGRYSPEKNHALLLEAFGRFAADHPGAGLLVIGGKGPLFEQTWQRVRTMPAAADVLLVENMDNPLPALARCDLFLLSSTHEGQGLAIAEAAIAGIPVVSVDAPGCGEFTRSIGGTVVENSADGLVGGMEAFVAGRVSVPRLDERRYTERALASYLHLFD